MNTRDMTEQAYKNGYEAGCKHGYQQGHKEGYEAGVETGRKAAIKSVSGISNISDATLHALYKMGKKHKQQNEATSVFEDCPCLTCVDGGIDMPYCAECNRANGFAYFRKKA